MNFLNSVRLHVQASFTVLLTDTTEHLLHLPALVSLRSVQVLFEKLSMSLQKLWDFYLLHSPCLKLVTLPNPFIMIHLLMAHLVKTY